MVAEILARRGVLTPDAARAFLDTAAYELSPPEDLPHLDVAVRRLRTAIRRGEQITVWGDFDADGQTSTALLVETLQALGGHANYHVPTRQQGHGVHQDALQTIIAGGTSLILTCDTGIAAHSEVAAANALGAQVIVTDHHVPGDQLPPALAVINPHLLPAGHPMCTLPGVGVAYELARALASGQADRALDLVALGIVADVATLTGDARHLVRVGIECLRETPRQGLRVLAQTAGLQAKGITEEHIAFALAPRLNALGRLADASHGVELLLTDDLELARRLATEMEGLNARRQWLTRQVTNAALAQIERDPALLTQHAAVVLSHDGWPAGIVGIVASRLAERFARPTVLIASPPGKLAAGSGRSIPGVNLIGALNECGHLFRTYGGHSGAAGFTIEPDLIPRLRAALSRAVARQMEELTPPVLALDAYVTLPDLTAELVFELSRLAPFGPGNPAPALAVRDLRVLSHAVIGRTQEHRRVIVQDGEERTQTVFWWQGTSWPLPRGRFDLAVSLRASDFQGKLEPQVEWLDVRLREPEAVDITTPTAIRIRDLRSALDPEQALEGLPAAGDTQVWAEVSKPSGQPSQSRNQVRRSARLIVWTLPPGPEEMLAVLESVQPQEVVLFASNPGMDDANAFLSRLIGLVKHILSAREGRANLSELAAATAQRVSTVLAGLDWLQARGQVTVHELDSDSRILGPGHVPDSPESTQLARARLGALLAETDAYRAYAASAPAEALVRMRDLETAG